MLVATIVYLIHPIVANRDRAQKEKEAKITRDADKATERLASSLRRRDIRAFEALLAKGARVRRVESEVGSLLRLAEA